jgi:hypothetical protein
VSISTALRHLSTICLLTTALAPALRAQEVEQEPSSAAVTIEFRGGTLADYVAAIRATSDEINVLMPPEAAKMRVPPVTLRNVGVEAALDAVTDIADGNYDVAIRTRRSEKGTNPVHVVMMKQRNARASGAPTAERVVRVYSLRGLTEPLATDPKGAALTLRPETILTAVQAGLGIGADEGGEADGQKAMEGSMKYHADSGLLFVNATLDRVNMVEQTIAALEQDLNERRSAARYAEQMQRQHGEDAEPTQDKKPRTAEKTTR